MRSLGIVAVVTIGANAFAQPAALNEHDVVVAAANRAGLKDVVEGTAEIELGRGLQARAYPNPEVSYTREQTFGTLGSSENYLSVAQAFDLGFRRRIRGEAGDLRAQAARLDGQHTRQQIAAEARLRFYEVLYRQQRVAALERWLGHVQSSLDIVTKREKRGDAAGYERKRFEREAALAAGRVATEQAELARADVVVGKRAIGPDVRARGLPRAARGDEAIDRELGR